MSKIIAICGKIASGKTTYAKRLQQQENAVILSCDEITSALFHNDLGADHDEMTKRIWVYLYRKGAEIVRAGCTVIFDWGFWNKSQRDALRRFCQQASIPCQWHYVDVSENQWEKNIQHRNAQVASGQGGDAYLLDEGLLQKLNELWEEPEKSEIDVWYTLEQ